MKNAHLVPPAVHDIITNLESPILGENEKLVLIQRLETIRDFCVTTLNRINRENELKNMTKRKVR